MTIPIALFIKKFDNGYYFVIKNLTNNEEYKINIEPITSITTTFEQFDGVVESIKKDKRFEVHYVSEDII